MAARPRWSAPAIAETLTDAVQAALAALDIGRAHLVGHSMGGAIAALLALRRPECAASLTLIARPASAPEINGRVHRRLCRRRPPPRGAVEVLSLLVHDPALVSRTMVEDVLRYKRLDGVTAALTAIAAAWFAGGRQSLDLTAPIASLALPVQLIWGREDRIIPVGHAEALATRRPVHILDRVGHLPQMERAGDVNRLVGAFVAASE